MWVVVLAVAVVGMHAPAEAQIAEAEVAFGEATRLFDALQYETALPALDRVIVMVEPLADDDATARRLLVTSLEMRARVHVGLGHLDDARTDFRSLLTRAPSHVLPPQISPRVVSLFDEIKRGVVGGVTLLVTPADAEVELDGAPTTVSAEPIALVSGEHVLTVRRNGYRAITQSVTVAAGEIAELSVALERVSATMAILTTPPGIEVVVDGTPRGSTAPGPMSAEWADWPSRLGVGPDVLSRVLVLPDLAPGSHQIRFRRDCFVPVERRIQIDQPDDFRLDPVKLDPAVATVIIGAWASGATAFVDGERVGTAPLTLSNVCEGDHTLELRAPHGRYVQRLSLRTGDTVDVKGEIRPAVALLAAAGLPEGLRGPDLRLTVERAFSSSRAVTLFAPDAEQADKLLAAERLKPGWLAFTRSGQPIGDVAAAVTDPARIDLSSRFSESLGVQGVAEIYVPSGAAPNVVQLSILAAGSGQPDVLELKLDDPASLGDALARLDAPLALFRPSVGILAIDVVGSEAPVVASVVGPASLGMGDVIRRVGGTEVKDVQALNAALDQRGPGPVTIEALGPAGEPKQVELQVALVARVAAFGDRTILFNKLILEARRQLAAAEPAVEPVARLNLAVGLMRLGNWTAARTELRAVKLAEGPGVSHGTVQFLLGLCEEALSQLPAAEAAWQVAATSEGLLTEDGPPVKELATRKLTEMKRRQSGVRP